MNNETLKEISGIIFFLNYRIRHFEQLRDEEVSKKNYSEANNYDYLSIGLLYSKKDILGRYDKKVQNKILEYVLKLERKEKL